jgi:hypothetical protein
MLKQVLNDLKGEVVTILDDGSDFVIKHPNVIRFKNGGKQEFYKKWQVALMIAEGTDSDFFLFMPSDFLNIDLKRIKEIHEEYKSKPYVYNIINDGREMCWNSFRPQMIDRDTTQVFFTDCGFFCNRMALDKIGFTIPNIDPKRFVRRTDISSGVGQTLTQLFNRHKVRMFKPTHSLAFHGEHESTMHPEHRTLTPLKSI